jgi:hypothetical protein
MSSAPPPAGWENVPTMPCEVCHLDVAAGAFCGLCGVQLSVQPANGPNWLRVQAYAPAPTEHLLQPAVVSSLFPQLPRRSRRPFQISLAAMLLVLVVFAALRWQVPLIAVGALGIPLLFGIYLLESDGYHDLPARSLLVTVVLGVGLGVGWALLTGTVVARSYGVALGASMAGGRVLTVGLVIPLAGAILMLVPVVLVRLSWPRIRESLDGFAIGSLGALAFTAAATLTRLVPQLATGLMARDRPMGGLMVQAGIRGVALPLIAAAVGGMVGAALWFPRRPGAHAQNRWPALAIVVPVFVAVLVGYVGLGVIDVARLPEGLQLGVYLGVTLLALLALRIVLHVALLHEQHDALRPYEPILCPSCNFVVPDLAFCPNCGVATRASSRSSRAARRSARVVPTERTPKGP